VDSSGPWSGLGDPGIGFSSIGLGNPGASTVPGLAPEPAASFVGTASGVPSRHDGGAASLRHAAPGGAEYDATTPSTGSESLNAGYRGLGAPTSPASSDAPNSGSPWGLWTQPVASSAPSAGLW
jgi:hypothetical protein